MQPFFSIGITTYKRNDLLKQCLDSILSQDFDDFEVIVGNDYQATEVNGDILGISDPRIKYVNYPDNLGEFNNLNELMNLATGRYFSWLADDDLMLPEYFSYYDQCLRECDYPMCAFAAFEFLKGSQSLVMNIPEKLEYDFFSGQHFINKALKRKIWPIGTMGMFNREYLVGNNGFPDITKQPDMLGLYGEYILLIQAGLQDKVPFIQQPLTAFRIHGDSWSEKNSGIELIKKANINFIQHCVSLLADMRLNVDFQTNIQSIMEICLYALETAMVRSRKSCFHIIYFLYQTRYFQISDNSQSAYKMKKAFTVAYLKTVKHLCGIYLRKIFRKD